MLLRALVFSLAMLCAQADFTSREGNCPALNNADIQTARNMCFSNRANATATYGHISYWNTSAVTSMAELFKDKALFNEDISRWDTGKVTQMDFMFYKATAFNQDIGRWDTSAVTNMYQMFAFATDFNQDIGSWDTRLLSQGLVTLIRR